MSLYRERYAMIDFGGDKKSTDAVTDCDIKQDGGAEPPTSTFVSEDENCNEIDWDND